MYDERRSQAVLAIVIVASFAMHVAAYSGLGTLDLRTLIQQIDTIAVEMVDEAPPPEPELPPEPEPEPEVPPPPPPEPVVRRERPVVPPPEEEAPPPEPPPAAEEQIEDFTGETLTNDQGEAWQSAVGSGAPMDAPIGAPTGVVTGRHVEGTEGGVVGGSPDVESGPRLVAVRDLSAPPGAPRTDRLASLIQRFYPAELRRLAVEGRATVRVRIGPDGNVSRLRVRSETEPGFGQACVDALTEAGRWDPGPRDQEGNPVSTEVNFECRFTVRI
jgi:protein TonB